MLIEEIKEPNTIVDWFSDENLFLERSSLDFISITTDTSGYHLTLLISYI
jgi:hypothetical protein